MEEIKEIKEYEPLVATPLKNGETAPILDETSYTTLDRMLRSSDKGDHEIAQLVLNTCDIRKSIYWIWELSLSHAGKMVNLRTKASRAFQKYAHLFTICSMSSLSFGEFCNKKEYLTPEIYQKLEKKIEESMRSQFRNTFYDVSFQIKDKYKHLPLTTIVKTVSYEDS